MGNYDSSSDSGTCSHPNMSQHTHDDGKGNITIKAYCPSCGMEW